MNSDVDSIKSRLADSKSRLDALLELMEMRIRQRGTLAAPFLRDNDEYVREAALECVVSSDQAGQYKNEIAKLLEDDKSNIKIDILEYLVHSTTTDYNESIIPLLQDDDFLVRAYAIWALTELGERADIKHLSHSTGDYSTDSERVSYLEFRIRHFHDTLAFIQLKDYLHDKPLDVVCYASAALTRIAKHMPAYATEVIAFLKKVVSVQSMPDGVVDALQSDIRELQTDCESRVE